MTRKQAMLRLLFVPSLCRHAATPTSLTTCLPPSHFPSLHPCSESLSGTLAPTLKGGLVSGSLAWMPLIVRLVFTGMCQQLGGRGFMVIIKWWLSLNYFLFLIYNQFFCFTLSGQRSQMSETSPPFLSCYPLIHCKRKSSMMWEVYTSLAFL